MYFSTGLYLLFVLILGSTCDRNALLNDYLIVEKVSAVGEFLNAILQISIHTIIGHLLCAMGKSSYKITHHSATELEYFFLHMLP